MFGYQVCRRMSNVQLTLLCDISFEWFVCSYGCGSRRRQWIHVLGWCKPHKTVNVKRHLYKRRCSCRQVEYDVLILVSADTFGVLMLFELPLIFFDSLLDILFPPLVMYIYHCTLPCYGNHCISCN